MSSFEMEQILKKHSITDYLSARGIAPAKYGTAGKQLYLCPLPQHADDTAPSFCVYDKGSRQDYHCYGCKSGGSIINLIHAIEGTSYKEIIQRLGNEAGLSVDSIITALVSEIAGTIESPSLEEEVWPYAMSVAAMTYNFLRKTDFDPIEFALCEKMYCRFDGFLAINDLASVKDIQANLSKYLHRRLVAFQSKAKKEEREAMRLAMKK